VLDELAANNGATTSAAPAHRGKAYPPANGRPTSSDLENWLAKELKTDSAGFPRIRRPLIKSLRYWREPGSIGRFYTTPEKAAGVATSAAMQGRKCPTTNLNDTMRPMSASGVRSGAHARLVIVKHANPCGVERGLISTRLSPGAGLPFHTAYGGSIALNRKLDAKRGAISESHRSDHCARCHGRGDFRSLPGGESADAARRAAARSRSVASPRKNSRRRNIGAEPRTMPWRGHEAGRGDQRAPTDPNCGHDPNSRFRVAKHVKLEHTFTQRISPPSASGPAR